jgi:probable phosphoglycerate mutase
MTMTASDGISDARLLELATAAEPRAGSLFHIADPAGVTEILLIRHGHILPATGIQDDYSLTEIGREQAEVLGDYLAHHKPLDAVISSPYRRALETAGPVAARQSLKVDIDPELREVGIHVPPGKTLPEVMGEEAWQAMRKRIAEERRWDVRGEYGESSQSIRERAIAAVERAITLYPGGRVALVTHGPVINAYVAELVNSPFDMLFQPRVTSVTVVWAKDGLRDLKVVASAAHLGTF